MKTSTAYGHVKRVSHCLTSSPTPGILATSPVTGIGQYNDIISRVSSHGTNGSPAHRAASVVVDVPREEHEKVLLDLGGLRETLGKPQSAIDAI